MTLGEPVDPIPKARPGARGDVPDAPHRTRSRNLLAIDPVAITHAHGPTRGLALDALSDVLTTRRTFAVLRNALVLDNAEAQLVEIVSQLGLSPQPTRRNSIVDRLTVFAREKARPRSLSEHFGRGRFPFHTDLAHWRVPCRYVFLACTSERASQPTELIPWDDLSTHSDLMRLVSDAVFLVRNGRASFYAPITHDGSPFIRLDPGCMCPANRAARRFNSVYQSIVEGVSSTMVYWEPGDLVLLDNWRLVHARGAPSQSLESPRMLIRVSCGGRRA